MLDASSVTTAAGASAARPSALPLFHRAVTRRRLLRCTLALLGLAASLLCACERSARHDVYRTRGLVRAVSGTGDELRIAIHHEAIGSFRDRERKRAPMPSMPMLFALHHGVAADGLTAGEKVALTFEVRWDERPTLVITGLTRLPQSTALTLSDEH